MPSLQEKKYLFLLLKGIHYHKEERKMMIALHEVETTTYADEKTDWRVDIINNKDERYAEAWIYQTDIGNKSFMFGMHYEQRNISFEYFVSLVMEEWEEYQNSFLQDADILNTIYDLKDRWHHR